MTDPVSRWNEVRRIACELEPQIALAGPDVLERWEALRARMSELERLIVRTGERPHAVAARKLATAAAMLLRLADDIAYAHA